jgi:hypothetical protein
MKMSRTVIVSAALLGLALGSGCASVRRYVASAAGPDYVLTSSQYERVDVTGSKLQTLVPTAGSVTPLPPISPIYVMSPEAFRALVQPGRGPTRR